MKSRIDSMYENWDDERDWSDTEREAREKYDLLIGQLYLGGNTDNELYDALVGYIDEAQRAAYKAGFGAGVAIAAGRDDQ